MSIDLRSTLGFERDQLIHHLKIIENDDRYTYYADIIRGFLSTQDTEIKELQQDKRFLVAAAASCNPLADLSLLSKNLKKFALVAALNPAIDYKTIGKLQKNEHPAISVFLSSNTAVSADPEIKAFSVLAFGVLDDIDVDTVDSWYQYSLDNYEDSPSESISELLQLLTLEVLGFFGEGGEYPFWQMLEDLDLDPEDKLWKVLGSLPRVPVEIYSETYPGKFLNILIARELAAEKPLSKELIEELVKDDCVLDFDNDSWFMSRSPRASVAISTGQHSLITQIIQEEISKIEVDGKYDDYSMSVMWRIAGNVNLNSIQFQLIYDFVNRNLARCSDEAFRNDALLMLKGGYCVDAPLIDNPALPSDLKGPFESLISQIENIGQ